MGRLSISISGMSPIGWRPPVALAGGGGGGAPDPEATLWVHSVFGDDSRTKATVAASGGSLPWATLGRAVWGSTSAAAPNTAEAADAGDVVDVVGNHAVAGSGLRMTPAWNPANSGTSGSPVVFRSTTGSVLSLSSSEGPVIGARSRSYITWQGFTINGVDAPSTSDTGHIDIFESDHVQILDCTITGDVDHPDTGQGNYNAIRVEASDDCLIQDCTLSEIAEEGVYGGNQAAIMTYDANRLTVEYCTIHQVGVGVYFKGTHDVDGESQADNIVRYNLIYDARSRGIEIGSAQGGECYQNIIYRVNGAPAGIHVQGWAATTYIPASPVEWDIYNNVIDGCDIGISYEGLGDIARHIDLRVWNNIVLNCRLSVGSTALSGPGDTAHEHNIYHGSTQAVANFGSNLSLASWQALSPAQDSASPVAITSDPLFTDEAGHDYHLQGGSPAVSQGRTFGGGTVNAGAYLTGSESIGRRT